MADTGPPISYQRQRICAEREVVQRRRVYPRLVEGGRMTQRKADDELATMAAIVETLKALEDGRERLI